MSEIVFFNFLQSYVKIKKSRMNTGFSALMRAIILAEKERFELNFNIVK